MPAFNEERTVRQAVDRTVAQPIVSQLIVVDDGSTDKTAHILDCCNQEGLICLLRHSTNLGKGAAIRTALNCVEHEFVIIQDADLEYDPSNYPRLVDEMLHSHGQCVFGSRFLGHAKAHLSSRIAAYVMGNAVQLLYGVRLSDQATCYKLIRTEDLRRMSLECNRFEFCAEVTAKLCRMGVSIKEIPIAYQPRSYRQGKKIRSIDLVFAVAVLVRFRRWIPQKTGVRLRTVE